MGMYDTIMFVGDWLQDYPTCSAGHQLESWQTKDLEDSLDTYYVYDGWLYLSERGESKTEYESGPLSGSKGMSSLLVTNRFVAHPHCIHAELTIYTHCNMCDPVLIEEQTSWGHVREVTPWCEYLVRFQDGAMMPPITIRVESRDDLKKKYPNHIPDTDRIAVRHFERRKAERND